MMRCAAPWSLRATQRLGHLLPGKVHYAADSPIKQEA
jgi:hypothetical protein